jgi:hypothetical protein
MAILKYLPLLLLAACYGPELSDCTVTCTSDNDCGGDQRCVAGLCAAEGQVCTGDPPTDGSPVTPPDTATDSPPDSGPVPQGILRIKIDDQGKVQVTGHGTCDSQIDSTCTFTVPLEVPLTLQATPHTDRFLEKWEEACLDQQGTVCTVTPTESETRVTAKFKKLPDDDDDDD